MLNNIPKHTLCGNYPLVLREPIKCLISTDGELQYKCTQVKDTPHLDKVVRTPEEVNSIFVDFQSSPRTVHCGVHKSQRATGDRFYWPGMSVYIAQLLGVIPTTMTIESLLLNCYSWPMKCIFVLCLYRECEDFNNVT